MTRITNLNNTTCVWRRINLGSDSNDKHTESTYTISYNNNNNSHSNIINNFNNNDMNDDNVNVICNDEIIELDHISNTKSNQITLKIMCCMQI